MRSNKYNVNEGQSGAGQGTVMEGVNDVHCEVYLQKDD